MSLSLLSAWENKAQGCGGLSQKEYKPFISTYWLLHMGHLLKSLFWQHRVVLQWFSQAGGHLAKHSVSSSIERAGWAHAAPYYYPWCGVTKITYLQKKLSLALQSEVKPLPGSRGLASLLKWIMRALQKRWDLFSPLATLHQVQLIKILTLRSNWLICFKLKTLQNHCLHLLLWF